jgi:hypothetical protein
MAVQGSTYMSIALVGVEGATPAAFLGNPKLFAR